jgi:hypothetical protein
MTTKRKWVLGFLLLASVPFSVNVENLRDAPYVFLTGFSERELVELAYLSENELEERIGFRGVPTNFAENLVQKDRVAHVIASYLGTLRWGPDLTLAFGYMREYVPWILWRREADPVDIAANYVGIAEALRVVEAQP